MSSDPTTSPSGEEQQKPIIAPEAVNDSPTTAVEQGEAQQHRPLQFSFIRWSTSGVVRVAYRLWTRIAALLFPENSRGERLALALHIPLPDKLNMSWVNERLAVGGRIRPQDVKAVALAGITAVVDTRSEYQDDEQALKAENVELLYLPTPDTQPLGIEQLQQGASWVTDHINQGGKVLIHCEHGVGRSVLLTCAVLVANGMKAHDALRLVQGKRWQASPNHRQVARLKEFEAMVDGRMRA